MVGRELKNLVSEWCGVGQSGTLKRKDLASYSSVTKVFLPSLDCWDSKSRLHVIMQHISEISYY